MNKKIKPRLRLFVEGKSEKNYFDQFGKSVDITFVIESIDMNGGGYSNFLKKIKEKGYQGCTAVVIIIDLDKMENDKGNFEKLIRYCNTQNKKCPTPYILMGTYLDFEYFACCHSKDYKNGDTSQFIINNYKYRTVAEFKADSKIYTVLNNDKLNRSYNIACDAISKKESYFKNKIQLRGKSGDINIKNELNINKSLVGIKNSNLHEFFKLIEDVKKIY